MGRNLKHQDKNITNYHNDHIASCLCCKYFYGSLGEPGYSEWTPPYPSYIECKKGEFDFGPGDGFFTMISTIHNTALHCTLYSPK